MGPERRVLLMKGKSLKILVIEDNERLSHAIKSILEPRYSVVQAFDGYEGYFYAKEGVFDLIVLDLLLPEMGGYEVLEKIRKEGIGTPVLVLTAIGSLDGRIRGFKLGADDYLVKPFSKDEFLLRIDAILRRSLGMEQKNELIFKGMVLYPETHSVSINGEVVDVKGRQYDVLEFLVSKKGQLVSKSKIFDRVWGFLSDTSESVVEVYVSAVRKQLRPYGYDRYIKTIRGAGYLLDDDEREKNATS